MITDYPEFCEITLDQRPALHALFQRYDRGLSEMTFSNMFLYRHNDQHDHRIARIGEDNYVFVGRDREQPVFMLPFELPEKKLLDELFSKFHQLKAIAPDQAQQIASRGYHVWENRDDFDYLYSRQALAELRGNKYHSKKNLVNKFVNTFEAAGRALLPEFRHDALHVLDAWSAARDISGDYSAAREAVEKAEELRLCGWIYYIDKGPVAFAMGEEINRGRTFLVKFEKAVSPDTFKGIYQFVNQTFVNLLPEKYETVNREQDLGDPGLRQAKMSYKPVGFVKKFRAEMNG
ncbi:MAG: DUF2156 domain-containing protein [Sedimentisphaerales bacterium]|nr:DUF2156 domain-containing protein [Sedimentisphaerales bacterium]